MKLWTDITVNLDFARLSPAAKLVFLTCLAEAGRCDDAGKLRYKSGPCSPKELARATGFHVGRQHLALTELVDVGFLTKDGDCYGVRNWEKYQPDISTDRVRQHRVRERFRNVSETHVPMFSARSGNAVEEEQDKDKDIEGRPDFRDLEPDIKTFIDAAAAENKSGRVSHGRVDSMRRDLADVLGKEGKPAFLYGLREANKKGIPNVNYVRKAAQNFKPESPRPKRDDGPLPEYRRKVFDGKELKPIGGKR